MVEKKGQQDLKNSQRKMRNKFNFFVDKISRPKIVEISSIILLSELGIEWNYNIWQSYLDEIEMYTSLIIKMENQFASKSRNINRGKGLVKKGAT